MKNANDSQIKIQDLMEKVGNRFELSVAIAKRARQLQEGFNPQVEVNTNEDLLPVHTAIREMQADKVTLGISDVIEDEDESIEKLDLALEVEIKKEEEEKKQQILDKKAIRERNKRSKSLLT